MSSTSKLEDVISLVTLRIIAKKKQGMISENDFGLLASFGAAEALNIVTHKKWSVQLEEMVVEELRKALELISDRSCARCRGTGLSERKGIHITVCRCVELVRYRGDTVLPVGDQYSNKWFTGEFAKNELGQNDLVRNVASAITLFLIGKQ
jgi:hypothetical protein